MSHAESPGGAALTHSTSPADTVLVTWINYDGDDKRTGGALKAAGLKLRHEPKVGSRSPHQLSELLENVVAAIVSTDPFERSVVEAARHLRVIARVGVGTDSIDVAAATQAGIVVTTTPGANGETTADHALAMILAAVRRIVEHDASVRRGDWERGGDMTPWDLQGTVVGVVGYGEIGRAVARRLEGFRAELLVSDPAVSQCDGLQVVSIGELLARADVVSLHLPLLETTRGIIGQAQLDLMRPSAILVNTSRGGLIDEDALAIALEQGRLRGAALDVFADEPHVPRRLIDLPNVVLTPHIGGLSERSIDLMTHQATQSVLEVLEGNVPAGVVNPRALEHARHATTHARAAELMSPRGS